MTISLTFTGETQGAINKAIEEYLKEQGFTPSAKPLASTQDVPEASTATTLEDKTTLNATGDNFEHDGVVYGLENTKRNIWILLNDGRVIFIASGGRLPADEVRAKNITKKEFNEIAQEEPERVAANIGQEAAEPKKADDADDEATKELIADANNPEEEETEDEGEEETEEEEEEEEETDDEDEIELAKNLVAEARKIEGGKDFVKELLEDYDARRVTRLDPDDVADFVDELEDWIADNEG